MFSMKLAQKIRYKLQPVDRLGNPANVEAGSVVVSSSNPEVFSVTPDPANELEGDILSVGVGTAQFDFSADADLGEGVETITGFSAGEVLPLGAVGFGIEFGEPVDV